jgi:hypothetical protein
MVDGGYQGNPGVIMPDREPAEDQPPLSQWKQVRNKAHKRSAPASNTPWQA